ncbi:MAG TPA: hypothetical protein VH186_37200 [Chloroflexia bacterium]|nr:hypothetical protein [Chloroflexia bacterium]
MHEDNYKWEAGNTPQEQHRMNRAQKETFQKKDLEIAADEAMNDKHTTPPVENRGPDLSTPHPLDSMPPLPEQAQQNLADSE